MRNGKVDSRRIKGIAFLKELSRIVAEDIKKPEIEELLKSLEFKG